MLTRDRVAGIVILLFSLAVMWETRVLPLGNFHNPGPGYMPMLMAIVLGAMAIVVALGGGGSLPLRSLAWPEKRHALAILAGCAFTALAMERIGYRLTVILLLGFIFWVVERRRPAVVLPHIKAGKLRPLAGWGAKRVAALPDLPTFKELGYDIEFYIWAGVFAPTGTPDPILRKLRDTARQAVQESDFKSAMTKLETPVAYLDAPEFQKFWDRDAKMLADAIKRVGKIEEKK